MVTPGLGATMHSSPGFPHRSVRPSSGRRRTSDAAVVWHPPHQVKPVYERLSAGAAAASAGRNITAFDRGKTMVVTARYSRMGTKMFHMHIFVTSFKEANVDMAPPDVEDEDGDLAFWGRRRLLDERDNQNQQQDALAAWSALAEQRGVPEAALES